MEKLVRPQEIAVTTYGLGKKYSTKSETFYYIPLTWKLGVCRIEALKIRISSWKPKCDRSDQAIFYFDVNNKTQANEILLKFKDFNFKELEESFDELFERDNVYVKNTGETREWLSKIIPLLRTEFELKDGKVMGTLKNKTDYSKYKCPYSHLEKECGHELHGPDGYEGTYSVWCPCGFRGPVFYLEPEQLKLELIKPVSENGGGE